MAYDLNSKTVSGRDWSCGAAPAPVQSDLTPEKLNDALKRIGNVMFINSQKLKTGLKLGAVNDLERQNFENFARAWRGYVSKVQSSRIQRKQLLADLSKWTAETNAWTVKLDKNLDAARAALKRPISTKPPEVLAVEVKKREATAEGVGAPAVDDSKNTKIMIGLGAGALALGLMLGGR